MQIVHFPLRTLRMPFKISRLYEPWLIRKYIITRVHQSVLLIKRNQTKPSLEGTTSLHGSFVAGDDQVQMFSTSFLTENCLSLQFLKGLKTFYMLQHLFVPYWTTKGKL